MDAEGVVMNAVSMCDQCLYKQGENRKECWKDRVVTEGDQSRRMVTEGVERRRNVAVNLLKIPAVVSASGSTSGMLTHAGPESLFN